MRQKVALASPTSPDQSKEGTKCQDTKVEPSATMISEESEHLKCAGKCSECDKSVLVEYTLLSRYLDASWQVDH